MPRLGITAYDLLVSCPGDVMDYLEIINDSVDNFNRIFGTINNIEVVTKHWSTDSYPQSGDKPQELLNKQIVRNCDAAIVVFWTRFGTPTDKYGSGTEEEIEEMLSAGKQIFMYFLDVPMNPSKVDIEQYKKIEEFKEKYKDRGIYFVIKDKEELQKLFTNHLSLYFLQLIAGMSQRQEEAKPNLHVSEFGNSVEAVFRASNLSLCDSEFIHKKNSSIIAELRALLNNKLLPRTPFKEKETNVGNYMDFKGQRIMDAQYVFNQTEQNAEISEDVKEVINLFAKRNNLELDEYFWNVGDLKKYKSLCLAPFGGGLTLEGTDDEKSRYNALIDLYWDIVKYNEYITYFSLFNEKKFVRLVLNNSGNTFDEDIDVKLIIPKGFSCHVSAFSYPEINIIKEINEMHFGELFKIKGTENIQNYAYYPIETPSISMESPFITLSDTEKYEKEKRKYDDALERIFYYDFFTTEESDIVAFHIEYLKHHTSMAFPSVLLFNKIPPYIEYELKSKHLPEIVTGKLRFQE